jgi:hypothetical protein
MADRKGELLGDVETSMGNFKVFMPTVGEMMGAGIQTTDPKYPFKLAAVAIGVSLGEFSDWGISDAIKVLNKLSDAIERL